MVDMSTIARYAVGRMAEKLLSPYELRVWHAFRLMNEDVLARVGRDIAQATGLSGTEFGVLSRLEAIGRGEMRQQALARVMGWDKSRLSHQLKRMEKRSLIERRSSGKVVQVALTELGREKLDSARPIHAQSVRKNLLHRMSAEQTATIVRISNLLGEEP
jgi:DNA-binding MarR family transcriptional regulator